MNREAAAYWMPAFAGMTAFSENRLLVPDAPRPSTARRDRKHGETEPNHHHSHEFEGKGVHGNSPQ
jgi:hypothetical protein